MFGFMMKTTITHIRVLSSPLGFTLIELMGSMAIIALMTGSSVSQYVYLENRYRNTAYAVGTEISESVRMWKWDDGAWR